MVDLPLSGAMNSILAGLAAERPIFHSEADFQHALAWKLNKLDPHAKVRLERRLAVPEGAFFLDLLIASSGGTWAIELKYKTRKIVCEHGGESFELTDQSAQDLGRYDFLKDIQRLEVICANYPGWKGLAVFLTNDSSYWRPCVKKESGCWQFGIDDGRVATGTLSWGDRAGAGTRRGRESPIVLQGHYSLAWQDYSDLSIGDSSRFRHVIVEVL